MASPGTGKTTIGRALGRRLKSKFVLIDGSVVSGPPGFYQHVHRIFEAAKHNAPASNFIDNTDVVFEGGQETGFYGFVSRRRTPRAHLHRGHLE